MNTELSYKLSKATEEDATIGIQAFIRAVEASGHTVTKCRRKRHKDSEHDGYYAFTLTFGTDYVIDIQMPGLPIEQIQCSKDEPWKPGDYPQISVGGSWWYWPYAVNGIGEDPDFPAEPEPDDLTHATWHSVWLSGDWHRLTHTMPSVQREYAADCVAAHHRHLNGAKRTSSIEPAGLYWWESEVGN